MSLSKTRGLTLVAEARCRELRRHSTRAEKLVWVELRDRRFMGLKFRRQHPLFHDVLGKETFYITDFYCHEARLAVEVDGKIHLKQWQDDMLRTEVLNLIGVSVLRFTNEQVESDIEVVLGKLRRTIESILARDAASGEG